ncbi:MAG TPA: MFS transporter [Steroidobacteraceae bacterium]
MSASAKLAEDDPRRLIAERPMTALQIVIIAVLFCLNALDGFDVLAISFAAPGITRDWAASPQAIGVMISVGLFAAGFGSLVVAPLADRVGRRPMIFASLVTMTVGALICATATGTASMSVGRLFTGTGVGALVPCISALTAEYSSRRYRDRCVIIMAVGFPVGGLIGGQGAALLLQHFDWRAIFIAGAVATGVLTLVPIGSMPESIDYLLVKRPARALERVNRILARLHHPPVTALPAVQAADRKHSVLDIFTPGLLLITLLITLSYGLHGSTLYYSLNWIPKIGVDLGLSQAQAAGIAAWCSGGGIIGALVAAALATRFEIRLLTSAALVGAFLSLWLFAHAPGEVGLLVAAALLLGSLLYGAQVSLYALMTRSFPVHVRATGVGFVTGAGRLGGAMSPIVSGHLLGMGLPYSRVSTLMALGSLMGAIAVAAAGKTEKA